MIGRGRGPGLLGRRRYTWILAVIVGLVIGFAVTGVPDPRRVSLSEARVPVTVAPGALDPLVFETDETGDPDGDGAESDDADSDGAESETSQTDTTVAAEPGDESVDGAAEGAGGTDQQGDAAAPAEVRIAVADGGASAGTPRFMVEVLEFSGYRDVVLTTAAAVAASQLFAAGGFEQVAAEVAAQLSLDLVPAPIAEAPPTVPGVSADVLVLLGGQS